MDTNTPKGKPITNTTGPDGACLCPACNRGAVWVDEATGTMKTSPMRRLHIPGKVNALFHTCCVAQMLAGKIPQGAK